MFEFQYSDKNNIASQKEALGKQYEAEQKQLPLMWGEHCIECSAPECYFTCNRFVARPDGHCRRFEDGIEPVVANSKLGAKVVFKPWAKLEAKTERILLNGRSYERMAEKIYSFGRFCRNMAGMLP